MLNNSSGTKPKQDIPVQLMQAFTALQEYGVFMLDQEGKVIFWNQGAEKIQGYLAKEILNKPFAALYEKEIGKPEGYFNELIKQAKVQGQIEEEGWRQHKAGHYYWSTLHITPTYDTQHALIDYTLISRDLTERKLAAEMSEISEASQQTPVLATSNIIWARATDGQFTSPHLQWEHFTGQLWPDYQGFGWLKMHPAEEHEKIKAFWQKLSSQDVSMLQGNWQALQHPSVNKDLILKTRLWSKIHQEYRYTVTTVVPRFNTQGFYEWFGNEKDIHKMAVTELQLEEKLEEQRLIVSAARMGLWHWDLKTGHITLDNNAAVYLGMKLNTPNHSFNEMLIKVHPEDKTNVENLLQTCIQTGEQFNTEFRVMWPDGSLHYVAGSGKVHSDMAGMPVQMLGCYWDVTEQKQLEHEKIKALQNAQVQEFLRAKQAEDNNQRMEEFIDTICHEIRNPLNGIYGGADLLQIKLQELTTLFQVEKNNLPPATAEKFHVLMTHAKKQLETIDACARQQEVIVNDVLDFSKLENNKIELNPEPFQVKKLFKRVAKMFAAPLAQKNLALVLELPEQPLSLKADAHRLTQVVINLVSNAVKFTHTGKITIVASTEPLSPTQIYLHIKVLDTGMGMTEEELGRLFNRFSQASGRTAKEHGGSGLGLAISKKLVERMGGTIQVQSQKWCGTEFSFKIIGETLSEEEKQQITVKSKKPTLLNAASTDSKKAILIVEDNPINQRVMTNYLEQKGYFYQVANNGMEALEKCEHFQFDLIFMDIEMPVMGGFEATRRIREQESQRLSRPIPIIGLSGNARKEQIAAAKQAGMTI
jgi:PAS domain S-box-containing protein